MSDDIINWLVRSCAITPANLERHSGRALAIADSCDRMKQRWSRPLAELQNDAEDVAEALLAAAQYIRERDDADRDKDTQSNNGDHVQCLGRRRD